MNQMTIRRLLRSVNALATTGCTLVLTGWACAQQLTPVQVVADMNAEVPGHQSVVIVGPGTSTVSGISVWIIDPLNTRSVYWIGYAGGIDRGISFGHAPSNLHIGSVSSVTGNVHTPINPLNGANVVPTQWLQAAFAGPEVQYLEFGAQKPALIPASPAGPVFTVNVQLENARPGDRFNFHLLDFTAVWSGGGAFSTQGPFVSLDTGGDSFPDQTITLFGVDPDAAVPTPPAAFLVQFIDGPAEGGPAQIIIAQTSDFNLDGKTDVDDLVQLLATWGECPPKQSCLTDIAPAEGDGAVNVDDLVALLANWG